MDYTTLLYPVISIGGLGILFGLGLGYAGIKFRVETDPMLPLIRDALPGANCGGCGFAGCDAFANAVLNGEAKPSGCPVGGASSTQKIAEIMGITAEFGTRQAAYIKCVGTCEKAKSNYEYSGMDNCTAASQLAGGGLKECSYGCIGSGSCKAVCAFGAVSIENGIAKIDTDKCTACGKCVSACPKHLIELIPAESKVHVACNSKDAGKFVRNACSVGCIACKLCEKACNFDAVHVTDNIAKIDYEKCTACDECTKKCPTKAISSLVG